MFQTRITGCRFSQPLSKNQFFTLSSGKPRKPSILYAQLLPTKTNSYEQSHYSINGLICELMCWHSRSQYWESNSRIDMRSCPIWAMQEPAWMYMPWMATHKWCIEQLCCDPSAPAGSMASKNKLCRTQNSILMTPSTLDIFVDVRFYINQWLFYETVHCIC